MSAEKRDALVALTAAIELLKGVLRDLQSDAPAEGPLSRRARRTQDEEEDELGMEPESELGAERSADVTGSPTAPSNPAHED